MSTISSLTVPGFDFAHARWDTSVTPAQATLAAEPCVLTAP
jgi:hypothetical protein